MEATIKECPFCGGIPALVDSLKRASERASECRLGSLTYESIKDYSLPNDITLPAHYAHGKIQGLDVIEDWGLGFYAGNVLKYLSRYRYKGTPVKDLEKAIFYLGKLLEHENAKNRDDKLVQDMSETD